MSNERFSEPEYVEKRRSPRVKIVSYLEQHTMATNHRGDHASEYLTKASPATIQEKPGFKRRSTWLKLDGRYLKHQDSAVVDQVHELKHLREEKTLSPANPETRDAKRDYLYVVNQQQRLSVCGPSMPNRDRFGPWGNRSRLQGRFQAALVA